MPEKEVWWRLQLFLKGVQWPVQAQSLLPASLGGAGKSSQPDQPVDVTPSKPTMCLGQGLLPEACSLITVGAQHRETGKHPTNPDTHSSGTWLPGYSHLNVEKTIPGLNKGESSRDLS